MSREDKSPAEAAIAGGAEPKPIEYGPSLARVEPQGRAVEREAAIQQVFGRQVSNQDLASLVGAPDDSVVRIAPGWRPGTVQVSVHHPDIEDAVRTIRRENGKVMIHNDLFRVTNPGNGVATKMVGRQMEQARKMGVSQVDTLAARDDSPGGYIGYKVWPKFGYDAPVPAYFKQHLPESLKGAKRISDVYSKPEGIAAWEKHGTSINLVYDLKPGSRSNQVMAEFQARQARRRAGVGN